MRDCGGNFLYLTACGKCNECLARIKMMNRSFKKCGWTMVKLSDLERHKKIIGQFKLSLGLMKQHCKENGIDV